MCNRVDWVVDLHVKSICAVCSSNRRFNRRPIGALRITYIFTVNTPTINYILSFKRLVKTFYLGLPSVDNCFITQSHGNAKARRKDDNESQCEMAKLFWYIAITPNSVIDRHTAETPGNIWACHHSKLYPDRLSGFLFGKRAISRIV